MSSKIRNLIIKSLEYYDQNTELYKPFFSKVKYYSLIISTNDIEHNKIIFYDKNGQEIFRSRYEILGFFNSQSNTWIWAWSIPTAIKNSVNISKKILNYGFDLLPFEDTFLKTELITSRFRISHKIQLDIHISIASYLSKIPMIFKLCGHPTMTLLDNNMVKIDKNACNMPAYQLFYLFILDFNNLDISKYNK